MYKYSMFFSCSVFFRVFADVPQVTLQLGSTLNSTQIREGADVYFECTVRANPWIQKVSWRQNVRIPPKGKQILKVCIYVTITMYNLFGIL